MARLTPTESTLKAIFARSGNQCAFPGCMAPLIDDRDLFVGQVAHICAASQEGPRFDFNQNDEERRSPSNLLVLCYPHHVRIDRLEREYSSKSLRDMKNSHEALYHSDFSPPSSAVSLLTKELDSYWAKLDYIANQRGSRLEVSIGIDIESPPEKLCDQLLSNILDLRETLPDLIPENIGDEAIWLHNRLQDTETKLRQIELVLLHLLLARSGDNSDLDRRIREKRNQLDRMIRNEIMYD